MRISAVSPRHVVCSGREDERVRVWVSSAAVRPPFLRLSKLVWSDVSPPSVILERMRLLVFATLFGVLLDAGDALQIQCYQCEEMKHNDCSTPEYIVNCTVNVQDMCQKEVLVKPDGIHYRKSCASSGACLIASSGYQQFCTGRLNSVCISCCNTPLCNGPKRKRPVPSAATSNLRTHWPLHLLLTFSLLPLMLLLPLT
ncbi:ly6/PLAUR domain-containing protein 1-like [Toxotes jaculatrix]|uniref:ly6/PLAUR domain-containing protein 1-like n=1 Tax=Toxotes jaculatrix TaxID=941984 RepID=UPI001B3AEFA8|nr:ly6/PLAUR domain-containing protein 1-like [Toxotes jaculatrix]